MHTVQLDEITEIYTGVSNSQIQKTEKEGLQAVGLLQSEGFSKEGLIREGYQAAEVWVTEKLSHKYFLKHGDVIIQARGGSFKAALVRDEFYDQKVIFNNNTLVLRTNQDILLPETICYFLNSQIFAETVLTQTKNKSLLIRAKDLKDLEYRLPSMNDQVMIRELFHLQANFTKSSQLLLQKRIQLSEELYFLTTDSESDRNSIYQQNPPVSG